MRKGNVAPHRSGIPPCLRLEGLASLRDALGEHFIRGVIVHAGQEFIPMGDRLFAVPFGMMFTGS